MKTSQIFLTFLLIACFIACKNRGTVIVGSLPNDNFDKQAVYWVPLDDEHPKPVDSTHIDKNKFRLVISSRNFNKLGVIRVRLEFRLDLQEILVFTEPGTIFVNLDKNSSASGTPLNQTLQQWKEKKFTYDSTCYSIRVKYRNETIETEKIRYKSELDDIEKEYYSYIANLVEQNNDNAIGQFLKTHLKSDE